MRSRTYIRLFFVILVIATSFLLFSYVRKKTASTTSDTERSSECGGKSCDKKTQSEFILWESLTRNLLSARG